MPILIALESTAAGQNLATVAALADALVDMFGDELRLLSADWRAHSLAVGRKALGVSSLVPPGQRADLVTAATLHDIGYGHPLTGLHVLDGARYLASVGFSPRPVPSRGASLGQYV